MYNRCDFLFSFPPAVKYIGSGHRFERPSRLTKFDIACVLDSISPQMRWLYLYDAFSYSYLVNKLNDSLK